MFYKIKKYIVTLCLLSCCTFVLGGSVFAVKNDWLKDAYRESHTAQAQPYSVDAEVKDLFDTNIDAVGTIGNIIDGEENPIELNDSIFVRFTRFLTRVAVVLAIPMLLYSSFRVITSMGDDGKLKAALVDVGKVAAGLLIALLSVMIIYFVTSLTRSSVDFFIFS